MSETPAPRRPDSTDPENADAGTDGVGVTPNAAPEAKSESSDEAAVRPREIGGRGGLDPTRYGDWEKNGRCIDF